MTLVDKARTAAYLSIPLFLAALLVLLWPLRSASGPFAQKLGGTLDSANLLIAKGNTTLDEINAPCTSFHGSATCGPIAQLSQTEKNIGILAGQGALQVKQNGALLTTAGDSVISVSSHLNDAVDQLRGTAGSATATLDAGRNYFVASQPKFDLFFSNVDGLTSKGNTSMDTFNALLARPAWATILDNGASITTSGAHMMQTTDAVETKITKCTLHPTFGCQAKSDLMFGAQAGGYLLSAMPK